MSAHLFGGFQIRRSNSMVEQFRFPRTKKRRIQKKWAKRPENFRPRRNLIVDHVHRVIYGHPLMIDQLIAGLATVETKSR